jgi:hypothetical protein
MSLRPLFARTLVRNFMDIQNDPDVVFHFLPGCVWRLPARLEQSQAHDAILYFA